MNLLKRFAQISSIALASAMIASCASDSSSSGSSSEAETTENTTEQQKKAEAKPSYAYAKTAFDASSDAESMSMKECQGRAGVEIKMGIDKNADGKLEGDEVAKTEYVCDGAKGAAGAAGAKGDYTKVHTVSFSGTPTSAQVKLLVKDNTKVKPAVTNAGTSAAYCKTVGGVQVNFYTETGKDDKTKFDAKDTVLKTTYVCNGADGSNGQAGQAGNNAPAQLAYQAKFTDNLGATTASIKVGDVNVIQKAKAGEVAGYDRVIFDLDKNANGTFTNIGVLNDGKASELENWSALGVVTNYYKTTAGTPPTVFFNVSNDLYFVNADDMAVKVDLTATIDKIEPAATGVFVIDNTDSGSKLFFVKNDGTVENLAADDKLEFKGANPKNIEVIGDTLFLHEDNASAIIKGATSLITHVARVTAGGKIDAVTLPAKVAFNVVGAKTSFVKGKTGVFVIDATATAGGAKSVLAFVPTTGDVQNLAETGMDFKDTAPQAVVVDDTLFLSGGGSNATISDDGAGNKVDLEKQVGRAKVVSVLKPGQAAPQVQPTKLGLVGSSSITTPANVSFVKAKTGIFVIDHTALKAKSKLFFAPTTGNNATSVKHSNTNFDGTAPTTAVIGDTLLLTGGGNSGKLVTDTGGNGQKEVAIVKKTTAMDLVKLNTVAMAVTKDKVSFEKGETGIFVIGFTAGVSKSDLYFVKENGDVEDLGESTLNFDDTAPQAVAVGDVLFLNGGGTAPKTKTTAGKDLLANVAMAAAAQATASDSAAVKLKGVSSITIAAKTDVTLVEAKTGIFVIDAKSDASDLAFIDKEGNETILSDGINFKGRGLLGNKEQIKKQVVSTYDNAGKATGDKLHLFVVKGAVSPTYKDNPGIAFSSGETKHRLLNPQHVTIVDGQAVHVGGKLYFGSGSYLWESDGTKANTKVLGKHTVTSIAADGNKVYFYAGKLYKIADVTADPVVISEIFKVDGTTSHTLKAGAGGLTVVGGKLYGIDNNDNAVYLGTGSNLDPVIVADDDDNAGDKVGDVSGLHVLGNKIIAVGAAKLADATSTTLNGATEIKGNSATLKPDVTTAKPVLAGDALFVVQHTTTKLFVTKGTTATQVKDDGGTAVKADAAFKAAKVGSSYYVLIAGKLYSVDMTNGNEGKATVVDYGADSGVNLAVVKNSDDKEHLFVITKFEVFVKKEGAKEVFKETDLKRYGFTKQTNDYITHPTVVGNKLYFLANSASGNYFSNHGIEWFYTEQN